LNDGKPLSRTTFYRLRQAIEDMFGIRIECDNQHQYFISNPETLKDNSTQNWMLRTLTVNSLLLDGLSIKDQLLLEDIPAGLEHLETVINAIKDHHTLRMSYKKFSDSEPYSTLIEPYCLKLFHQRWYLLGKSDRKKGNLAIYALDRMTELTETDHNFKMDPRFDAESYFHDYFGVIPDQTVKSERIVLRAYSPMDNYLRTLPLHHSQKEIATEKQSALFEYYVAPTHDFIQAILKEGHELEVIEPQSLRKTIHNELAKAIKRYK
jgi:predicted DNA-binding transcriptional regulator YafY